MKGQAQNKNVSTIITFMVILYHPLYLTVLFFYIIGHQNVGHKILVYSFEMKAIITGLQFCDYKYWHKVCTNLGIIFGDIFNRGFHNFK